MKALWSAISPAVALGMVMHVGLVVGLVVLIGTRFDWLAACLVGAAITAVWTFSVYQIDQQRREHELYEQRAAVQRAARSGRFHDPDEADQ